MSNRRRKQIDPSTKSVAKVFATADEHHMLQFRIATGRITAVLKSRGMYARDAFVAIDRDRDGLLDYEDLRRGLEWLGLKMDHSLVREFIENLDTDKDGRINLEEFKSAVGWEQDSDAGEIVPEFNGVPLERQMMPENDGDKVTNQIPAPMLACIKVKVKKITKFSQVWTSRGSMSRKRGSVWEPSVGTSTRQKKVIVSLGHYAGSNYDNPNKDGRDRLTLEITDTAASWVGGSNWMPVVLDQFMPHPARFRLAWSLTHGSNPFYAWQPIPPSEKFVALGMVGTTSENPPDIKSIRCVSIEWTVDTKYLKMQWNDEISGSIWDCNSLHLAGFVSGHDPPRQKPKDLRSSRFFLKDYSKVNAKEDAKSAKKGTKVQK